MKLKGFDHVGNYELSEQIQENLIAYFNEGFLQANGFYEETDGVTLIKREDLRERYNGKTVYQLPQKNIVYQNLSRSIQPLEIKVNNAVVTNYRFEYFNSYIIFDTDQGNNVSAKYTYGFFSFVSDDQEWFRRIMLDSYKVNETTTTNTSIKDILFDSAVQLPVTVVEMVPRGRSEGMQLGGGQWVYREVLFNIFTDTTWGRKKLLDVISYQQDRSFPMFDLNAIAYDNKLPINDDGTINTPVIPYDELVSKDGPYYWKTATFKNYSMQETLFSPPIYQAQIRLTICLPMGNL